MKRLSLLTVFMLAICSPAMAQVSGSVTVFGPVNAGDMVTLRNKAQIQALSGVPASGQCVVYTGTYPTGNWAPGSCVGAGVGTVTSAQVTVGTGLIATDIGGGAFCNSAIKFGCAITIDSAAQITSFKGRFGAVVPAINDYNFTQLAGSLACSQLPAFTQDVTNANCVMTIPNGTVTNAKMAVGAAAANLGASNYVASFNSRTGAVVPGSSDYISSQINNTSAGTGGQTRTILNKWGDFLTTGDYSSGTNLYNAAVAAGVGTVIVPTSGSSPTLPSAFPNASFDFYGPSKTFSQTLPDPFSPADLTQVFSRGLIAYHDGPHSGTAHMSLNVSTRAVGSGVNGPSSSDTTYNCSSVKLGIPATGNQGQLDCYQGYMRNTGPDGTASDTIALEFNLVNFSNTGTLFTGEGLNSNYARNGSTLVRQQAIQMNTIDAIGGNGWGFVAGAAFGTLNEAYLAQEASGASYTFLTRYITNDSVTRYTVNRLGQVNAGSFRTNGTAAPTINGCTGLGSTGVCSRIATSSDSVGALLLQPSGTSIGSTGVVVINFSATIGTNGSSCTFTLSSGSASWTSPATIIGGSGATTSYAFTWLNGSGTGLAAGQSYVIHYICAGY